MGTSISKTIELNRDECIIGSREFFEEIAHIENDIMRNDAENALNAIASFIKPMLTYKVYDSFEFDGGNLLIHKSENDTCQLQCRAFERIDSDAVKGVCVFALTAGGFRIVDDRMTVQLFADYWGTAVAEYLKTKLAGFVKQECGACDLSEFFGPGLYGMPMREMQKLPDLCGFSSIGIAVSNSCYLIPEKSVAGLVFITGEGYLPLEEKCEHCLGNISSCSLCRQ